MVVAPEPIYINDPTNLNDRNQAYRQIGLYFKLKRRELFDKLNIPRNISRYKEFIKRFKVEIRGEYDHVGWLSDCNHSLLYSSNGEGSEREIAVVTERVNGLGQLKINFLEANLDSFLNN